MSILLLNCKRCGDNFYFDSSNICHTCGKSDSNFCLQCHNHNHRYNPEVRYNLIRNTKILMSIYLIAGSQMLGFEMLRSMVG